MEAIVPPRDVANRVPAPATAAAPTIVMAPAAATAGHIVSQKPGVNLLLSYHLNEEFKVVFHLKPFIFSNG